MSKWLRGLLLVVLLAAYCTGCGYLLSQVGFSSSLSLDMRSDAVYSSMVTAESLLPQPDPVVVCMPCSGSPYSENNISTLVRMIDNLESEGSMHGSDRWIVRSILGESVPVLEADSITFRSLSELGNDSESLQAMVNDFPTLGKLFCPGEKAWLVYVYPQCGSDEEISRIASTLSDFPDLIISGMQWVEYQIVMTMKRDLAIIIPFSILALFLVFLVFEKAGRHAIVLTIATLLPAIGTIALYPLLNFQIKMTTVLAPILVLSLSTTYVVHVYHHFTEGRKVLVSFYRERGKVILWSGVTTLLGFASLIFSPLDDIRTNGIFVVLGLFVAFFWDLLMLPIYMSTWYIQYNRYAANSPLTPIVTKISGKALKTSRIAVCIFLFVAACGVLSLKVARIPADSIFVSAHPYDKELNRLMDLMPLTNEILVFVDSGVDGGIVDPVFFNKTKQCIDSIEGLSGVRSVYAYTDIVDEVARAFDYTSAQLESTSTIGELLELVPIDPTSPRLYDLSCRVAMFKIAVDSATRSTVSLRASMNDSWKIVKDEYPEATVTLAGTWPRWELSMKGLVKGQIVGLFFYFSIVLFILAVSLRSMLKAVLVCFPPVAAIIASLGICGYAGWGLTPPLSLVIAAIAGVGIDDAILWSFFSERPSIERSIVGTSVLLVCGLLPLLLSLHADLIRSAVVVIIGLFLSTTIVLKVLPWENE